MKRTLPQIVRREVDSEHYYWVDGKFTPAVTRILDEAAPVAFALRQFFLRNTVDSAKKILEETGVFGSMIHADIERLLKGEELDLTKHETKAKKHLMSFHNWFHEFKPDMDSLKPESTIASLKHRYAGTLDLACTRKGKKWIIDFKTGSGIYHNHELQLAAYRGAYEEMHNTKVDHVAIVRTGSRHKVGYEVKEVKKPFKAFLNVYQSYLDLHGGKIPNPPTIPVYPDKLKIIE